MSKVIALSSSVFSGRGLRIVEEYVAQRSKVKTPTNSLEKTPAIQSESNALMSYQLDEYSSLPSESLYISHSSPLKRSLRVSLGVVWCPKPQRKTEEEKAERKVSPHLSHTSFFARKRWHKSSTTKVHWFIQQRNLLQLSNKLHKNLNPTFLLCSRSFCESTF